MYLKYRDNIYSFKVKYISNFSARFYIAYWRTNPEPTLHDFAGWVNSFKLSLFLTKQCKEGRPTTAGKEGKVYFSEETPINNLSSSFSLIYTSIYVCHLFWNNTLEAPGVWTNTLCSWVSSSLISKVLTFVGDGEREVHRWAWKAVFFLSLYSLTAASSEIPAGDCSEAA